MEELNEDNLPTEKTGKDLFKDCFVDLDRPLKKLDVLLYYGFDDRNQRVAAITRGEYSCVVAPAKLKKSFNKSLMAAAYIGGNTVNYSEHIYIGEGRSDGFIIDLDSVRIS